MKQDSDQVYYRDAGALPFAKRVSRRARLGIFQLFNEIMQPQRGDVVLDVGVSSEMSQEANILEKYYPYPENIVCASTSDGASILREFPAVRHVTIQPNASLPFEDRQFSIGYSNAVIEHVGSREQQAHFISEMLRVSEKIFIVFPNRLFPIEHHTALPLLHMLPMPAFRWLLRGTRYDYWAHEENLNLLFAWDAARLVPSRLELGLRYAGIGLGPFRSNILLYRESLQSN